MEVEQEKELDPAEDWEKIHYPTFTTEMQAGLKLLRGVVNALLDSTIGTRARLVALT